MAFKSAKAMQDAVDAYFDGLAEDENVVRPATFSGLAFSLGICTETLRNYGKDDRFFGVVKRARQRVEAQWEGRLWDNGSTGAIAWLNKNAGYREDQPQQVQQPHVTIVMPGKDAD